MIDAYLRSCWILADRVYVIVIPEKRFPRGLSKKGHLLLKKGHNNITRKLKTLKTVLFEVVPEQYGSCCMKKEQLVEGGTHIVGSCCMNERQNASVCTHIVGSCCMNERQNISNRTHIVGSCCMNERQNASVCTHKVKLNRSQRLKFGERKTL